MMRPLRLTMALATVAAMALVFLGGPASAATITPGNTVSSSLALAGPLGTQLISTGSGNLGSSGAVYTDYVYKGNSYGSEYLTYVLVINPGNTTPVSSVDYSTFSDFTELTVGYCSTNCGLGQLGAPSSVSWSADASTVTFNFDPALNRSGNTDFLEIQTNGKFYQHTADICLNGNLCSGGFDPLTPVPIPAAFPLLASGLAAFGMVGWRRRKRDVAAT